MSTPREQFIEHFEHKVIRACVRWSLKRGKKQEVMSNTQNLRHQSSTYYVCVYIVTAILPVASSQGVLEKYTIEMNCARKEQVKIRNMQGQ
jgi:uncharacterized membrane protein